jgi:predicted nuclease of restriction endonuclease-like RecB superfamily
MKLWNKLCDEIAAIKKEEMKKPKKKRLKKNLKTGPGKRRAKEHAALAGMKSIGEVRCAADMDRQGIKWKYEAETLVYQHQPQKYTPDFLLSRKLLIEYKGKMTNETRKKLLSIKRCNPGRRICIVFEKPDNKLSSRPNASRYWQWAERNGFEWSDQVIRPEWLRKNNTRHNKGE